MKRRVFYCFHFGNDVMRVQQIRNIGVIEGNAPVSPNDWETVRSGGESSIKNVSIVYSNYYLQAISETAWLPAI